MVKTITVGEIVKTSVVTGFMIAAALIWKDVIVETIDIFYPQNVLFYKFLAAIIATVFVIFAIYVILRTEQEAETLVHDLSNINTKKRRKIIKEIKKEERKEEKKNKA